METSHTIKRSGEAPYKFNGELIVEKNNYSPAVSMWHEINVYKKEGNGYVLVIKALKKAEGDPDIISVHKPSNAQELIRKIIDHDCKNDVCSDIDLLDQNRPVIDLIMDAVNMRQRTDIAGKNWAAMVGDLLYDFYMMSK